MEVEIKVPSMGESISEAKVGTLLKDSGSYVEANDEIIELETDKVNQVLYAPESGVVTWKAAPGDVVVIGQVIGIVDTDKQKAKGEAKKTPRAAPQEKKAPEPEAAAVPPPTGGARQTKEAFLNGLQPAAQPDAQPDVPPTAPTTTPRETRKKMSQVRKVIAARLVDVMQQTAMLTTFNEVDMSRINALRETHKEAFVKKHGVRLGYMPFFVEAAVSALKAFPVVNAYISGDEIVYRNTFDISIAIGTDKGLFVPVVRHCDSLSFASIEKAIEAYATKARDGKLVPGDLQGGGFTITNGGTYGSLLSTPILNPPQCAILGMHKIEKRPVVVDDQIVIRPMMYLAMSYDHRIIDGKEAVSFLVHIKNTLEDPARILLDI